MSKVKRLDNLSMDSGSLTIKQEGVAHVFSTNKDKINFDKPIFINNQEVLHRGLNVNAEFLGTYDQETINTKIANASRQYTQNEFVHNLDQDWNRIAELNLNGKSSFMDFAIAIGSSINSFNLTTCENRSGFDINISDTHKNNWNGQITKVRCCYNMRASKAYIDVLASDYLTDVHVIINRSEGWLPLTRSTVPIPDENFKSYEFDVRNGDGAVLPDVEEIQLSNNMVIKNINNALHISKDNQSLDIDFNNNILELITTSDKINIKNPLVVDEYVYCKNVYVNGKTLDSTITELQETVQSQQNMVKHFIDHPKMNKSIIDSSALMKHVTVANTIKDTYFVDTITKSTADTAICVTFPAEVVSGSSLKITLSPVGAFKIATLEFDAEFKCISNSLSYLYIDANETENIFYHSTSQNTKYISLVIIKNDGSVYTFPDFENIITNLKTVYAY